MKYNAILLLGTIITTTHAAEQAPTDSIKNDYGLHVAYKIGSVAFSMDPNKKELLRNAYANTPGITNIYHDEGVSCTVVVGPTAYVAARRGNGLDIMERTNPEATNLLEAYRHAKQKNKVYNFAELYKTNENDTLLPLGTSSRPELASQAGVQKPTKQRRAKAKKQKPTSSIFTRKKR